MPGQPEERFGRPGGRGCRIGRRLALLLAALFLAPLACAHRSAAGQPAPAGWSYRVDARTPRWEVELCFEQAPPAALVAAPTAADALVTARDPATGAALPTRDDPPEIDLRALTGRCVAYTVDLGRIESGWRSDVLIIGDDRMVNTDVWLWHPPRVAIDPAITVDFVLAEGERLSTPWPALGPTRFTLAETALRWRSFVALGRLEIDRFTVADSELEVVVFDAPRRLTPAGLRRWLTTAGEAAAALYGAFPVPHLQVLVLPVGGDGDPVLFGAVERGGGASILLLIGAGAADDAFVGEWVAIHEFLHLGMPFLERGDAWLPEGFVTYYTEVVRSRLGLRREADAWSALLAGFGRGEADIRGDQSLGEASRAMGELHAYSWVYWGGAAVALLSDVSLRESGGERSLDGALRHLRTCCALSPRRWTSAEVLAELDAWIGRPWLAPLCQELLATDGFAPLAPVYRKLGVNMVDGRVALDDAAPLAHVRHAIFDSSR